MEKSKIREFFLNHFPSQSEIAGLFSSQCTIAEFKKNEIFKKINDQEHYISIVIKGSAGVFSPGSKRDVCLDISLKGEFLMDFESLLTKGETTSYTMALEKLTLARIPVPSVDNLKNFSGYNEIIKSALAIMFSDRQKRLIAILSETPLERYRSLWEKSPLLFQNVSSTILSSYLGVSREHFSRIKKEFLSLN